MWAAAELWPAVHATAVESEEAMAALARELEPPVPTEWRRGRLPDAVPAEPFALVTLAYVLGELNDGSRRATVDRAWDATRGALVVVEPGTPDGYARVLDVRERLLARGGTVVAPCPHDRECPLAAHDDWCHFAVRVARSAAHRAAKDARLGHEDEKFSYVVVAREPGRQAVARVLRHPQIRGGHVTLELCAPEGLRREVVSKREGDRYRRARRLSWGDDFVPVVDSPPVAEVRATSAP
jgi:ribosomal protein RSM22 (predicted rRNA methylase)